MASEAIGQIPRSTEHISSLHDRTPKLSNYTENDVCNTGAIFMFVFVIE